MVTHVRYYRLMSCGTTAASQAPEVPPPSTGLYQTSGTTAHLSGSTGACVRAYIYSTGLKGCLFPFVLVPLFLALAAGHLYPCPGVRLALRILGSPWILSVEAFRSLPMDGGGSSSRSAPRKTKKRARRTLRPVVSDDEEVVIPTKPTRREKSAAAKQRVVLPLHRWKAKDWEAYRSKNPYEVPIAPCWTTV